MQVGAGQRGVGGHVLQRGGHADDGEREGHSDGEADQQVEQDPDWSLGCDGAGRRSAEADATDERGDRGQRELAVGVGGDCTTDLPDDQGEQHDQQAGGTHDEEDHGRGVHA